MSMAPRKDRKELLIVLFVFALISISCNGYDQFDEDDEESYSAREETWSMWYRRISSYWKNSGPNIPQRTKKPKKFEEPPASDESWGGTFKRYGCSVSGYECCLAPHIRLTTAVSNLRESLAREFFGQHIAVNMTLNLLEAHLADPSPSKPLVLSFHGWIGSGKTFLAQLIADALYRDGERSQFYRLFNQGYDFPSSDEAYRLRYKRKLQSDLLFVARKCDYALFVFDEVDQMPQGVLDSLAPFLDHPGYVGEVSFRKTIFIFLSNLGGAEISTITLNAWKQGRRRDSLTIQEFEPKILQDSYNGKGSAVEEYSGSQIQTTGLYKCVLLHRLLMDYLIPFLPMEREHIRQCVLREARKQGIRNLNTEEVMKKLYYWPPEIDGGVFSDSGCKRVEQTVKVWKMEHKSDNPQGRVEL